MSIDLATILKYKPVDGGPIAAEQSVDPIISPEDEALAKELVQRTGGQIGGSFLVHGVHANDIDVFMTEHQWRSADNWLFEQGVYPDVNDEGAKLYEDDGGYALDGVYNIGRVQIILVKPHYVDAYKRCAAIMNDNPGIFHDKADRVALHRILRWLANQGE